MFYYKYVYIFVLLQLSNFTIASSSKQETTFNHSQLFGWCNIIKHETLGHNLANEGKTRELTAWIKQGGRFWIQTNERDIYPGSTVAHRVTASFKIPEEEKQNLLKIMINKYPDILRTTNSKGEIITKVALHHNNPALSNHLKKYKVIHNPYYALSR